MFGLKWGIEKEKLMEIVRNEMIIIMSFLVKHSIYKKYLAKACTF